MMTLAAREAARRRGIGNLNALLRRWQRSAVAEVWRRASRMVLACLPRESWHTEFVLGGEADGGVVLEDGGTRQWAATNTSSKAA